MLASQSATQIERALRKRVAAFIEAYPDVYAMAYTTARQLIHKHTGKWLDPANVYWHRFAAAQSSSKIFTGWEHVGLPMESMTLIQLLMVRFRPHDQDNGDELNVDGGFYLAGPADIHYNETNEVAMLPSAVMADFWALDFASDCARKVAAFWDEYSVDFCMLTKAQMIAAAGVALACRQLDHDAFRVVLAAATGNLQVDIAWQTLSEHRAPLAGVTLHRLQLAGTDSRSVLQIIDGRGRQILYRPNAAQVFQVFEDEPHLYQWLQQQIVEPKSRAALVAEFVRDPGQHAAFGEELLRRSEHTWTSIQPLIGRPEGVADVFAQLRDHAIRETEADVRQQLTSNAELRKQIWMGHLGFLALVAGVGSLLCWPLALVAVGAGVSSLGLHIDQAVNGRTAAQRKAGVIGAVFDSVFVFLNLPLLASIGAAARGVKAGESSAQLSLAGFEGNEILDGASVVGGNGVARGVSVRADGETWIEINHLPYRVRYLNDLGCWAVVDAENPYAFANVRPVRLNEGGDWELMLPPRLQGGGLPGEDGTPPAPPTDEAYPTTTSPFWDMYMQANPARSERLSQAATERHEGLLDVFQAEGEDDVFVDSDNEDAVRDEAGNKHRVFKNSDNAYIGGNITLYSHDSRAFNNFLRMGERQGRDQVGLIRRFSEDLELIPCNNDVALYRGGSGERGTSGVVFRNSQLKPGDVLVNTDITSFSENPYNARIFANAHPDAQFTGDGPFAFDDTSVVFELPAKEYLNARPISPFSATPEEAESIFLPGRYFQIQRIEEVTGNQYRFMHVILREVPPGTVSGPAYDLRTGALFDREQYAKMLGQDGGELVDRFFPLKGE
ncbi:dermonecrotic toxin domain-containing protein [Pseudomonas sp. NPDC090208]|uniref:dermonecrotic toxin domain-containing protein n=1 Tax=Pseudomonas sp. NPDC090208 TaxID=3364478 RepID=UPI00380AFA4C